MYDVVLQLAIARTGLYMDEGVDLNSKYAIMCRKTVLIPENGEESIDNSDIFSGTSKTIMHRPFDICNHTNLYKFLHKFDNILLSCTIM